MILFNGHISYINSKIIRLYITNKVIFLYLSSHITHLLQPLDIDLFISLTVYYKSSIRDYYKFKYNFLVDKIVFLKYYLKTRNKTFTITNIKKVWLKAELYLFLPSLIID